MIAQPEGRRRVGSDQWRLLQSMPERWVAEGVVILAQIIALPEPRLHLLS